jgi:hypothetical protein
MPGAELTTSVRDGRVVVALRGDPDVIGAADAEAVLSTATCGAHCAPWEGGAIAYCHRVIAAAAAAAALTGPLRGRMRR